MKPTDKPLSAVLELSIGSELRQIENIFNEKLKDSFAFHLQQVHGQNLDDLRNKLHKLVDNHLDNYIDFLYGN